MNYNSYEIDLLIEPKNKFLKAEVNMGYVVKEDGLKKINFYIYKDLQVEEIIC